MEDLKELLEELKKTLEDTKEDTKEESSEDIKKDLKAKIDEMLGNNEIDKKTPIIVMVSTSTMVRGGTLKVGGAYSLLTNHLSEDIPIRIMTDAFVRGIACIDDDPRKIDKAKVDEILESIKDII